MKSGIYCIENLVNGKKYIGQALDLKKRKREHLSLLRRNLHLNTHLQNAWNKYGENNFIFDILCYCKEKELTKYEQIFINNFKKEFLYNIRECVDSNRGLIHSEESKEKNRKAHIGKPLLESTKIKMSESHKGYIKSEEHRKNLSKSGMGHLVSKATRKKMSEAKKEYWRKRNEEKQKSTDSSA